MRDTNTVKVAYSPSHTVIISIFINPRPHATLYECIMYIRTKTSRSGARGRDIKYSRVDARARSGATRGDYISRGGGV